VNPAFASLNLAQAVAIVAYEWFKLASGGSLPFSMPRKSEPAGKQQVQAFFANLEQALDEIEYFRPLDKRATMLVNLRNILTRMACGARLQRHFNCGAPDRSRAGRREDRDCCHVGQHASGWENVDCDCMLSSFVPRLTPSAF